MPAPRSILIDIHERGLNPQVAYKSVDSAGRIKVSVKEDVMPELAPEPVVEKPKASEKTERKNKTQKTEVSGEAPVEAVSNEGAGSVEHSKQEEAVSETPAAPRRGKRTAPASGT